MATKVIDALLITLGLDATNYQKGSKEAVKQLGLTRTAVVKSSNEMSKAINGAARSFALAFVGFNSTSGLVRMLTGLNEASRQLGIIARNTGQNTQDLKNWGNAFAIAGGSAESFLNTIQQIQQRQSAAQLTGVSGWESFLRFLEVGITETGDDGIVRARDKLKVLSELANAFQRLAREKGQPIANSLGLQMGFDQESMNVLIQGSAAIDALVDKQKQLAQNAEATAAAAAQLRAQWQELQKRADNLATVLLQKLQPATQDAFRGMLEFGEKNGPAMIDGLSKSVDELVKSLREMFDMASKLKAMVPDWLKNLNFGQDSITKGTFAERWDAKLSAMWDRFTSDGVRGVLEEIPGTPNANRAKFLPTIRASESAHGIPGQLLERIAQKESSFGTDVISGRLKSDAGAVGIMQLMPQFFPGAGKDPNADIETAAAYLERLRKQFGSWELAAAAYNAGPGTLNAVKSGRGGLPSETADYVNSLFGAGAAQRVAAPYGTDSVLRAPSPAGQTTTVGTINIYPAAGTADSVRVETARAIERRGLVYQSDYGQRP